MKKVDPGMGGLRSTETAKLILNAVKWCRSISRW